MYDRTNLKALTPNKPMWHRWWKKPILKQFNQWGGLFPGITIIAVIITARGLGLLEETEWTTFDTFLRLRPLEAIDERIAIIGINEADIRQIKQYPIPDAEITNLIQILQQYNPRAIGLDIVRDLPVEPGHDKFVQILQNSPNIIGIQQVLGLGIAPPPALPSEQIGFSDGIPDDDGRMRRSLLGTYVENNPDYQFSLALRLAEAYLTPKGFPLDNGIKDPHAMRFGTVELPRFSSYTGGYINTKAGGVQILVNYRNNIDSFRTFSLSDVKSSKIKPEWIQNRLVLIGMTTPSAPDLAHTTAIAFSHVKGEIYGVEFQAHAISQIISAVLDNRPLIKSLAEGWEYLWIIVWGLGGIYLSQLTVSPLKNLLAVILSSFMLIIICYLFLWWGWWLPMVPAVLALAFNGVILTSFYLSHQNLLSKLAERQQTIEETFTVIHNGPLQTLTIFLKKMREKGDQESITYLEKLNQEIREIGEYLKQDSLKPAKETSDRLRLGSGLMLDLKQPLDDLFYQVYNSTLNRDLPYFSTLKVKSRSFAPISLPLSLDKKRELCQFLEEALCNIGKHAQGVIRINAVGINTDGWYILSIKDNGQGKDLIAENLGTKQAQALAKKLGGQFRREKLHPKGVLCELRWQIVTQKTSKLSQWLKLIHSKLNLKN